MPDQPSVIWKRDMVTEASCQRKAKEIRERPKANVLAYCIPPGKVI
jgi:hypothetical protein